MSNSSAPIGVLDSGIGGFSVVTKLRERLPNEDIIYFGDNAHCPYGSKNEGKEVVALSQKIVDFLKEKGVKAIVIACNTISTQINYLNDRHIPIIEIIGPVCRGFSIATPRNVGIVATPLTTKTKVYETKLKEENPSLTTIGVASPNLAALIEKGNFESKTIDEELMSTMKPLLENDVRHVIWGCTHYSLVARNFKELFPQITFYDPAVFEADELTELLRNNSMPNQQEKKGSFSLYTSGSAYSALTAMKRLNLPYPDQITENMIL